MRAQKASINIDRLKICFVAPVGFGERLQNEFSGYGKSKELDMVYYTLYCSENNYDKLIVYLYVPMDGEKHKIGYYTINLNGRYAPYVFFTMENKALYTAYEDWAENRVNLAVMVEDISLDLGLRFNNITYVELCMDTNINVLAKVRKAIRNTEQYDMIFNLNKVTDPYQILPGYAEMYGGSRIRLSRIPTLYFRQKRDDGVMVKIYNKSAEMAIASPSKENYIPKWDDIENAPIYRIEATIRNEDIKYFCNRVVDVPQEEALCRLVTNERFRNSLWAYCVSNVLHFHDKATDKRVDLIDLCK